jgi:hypothetical protein
MKYALAAQGINNVKEFLRPITQGDCISLQQGNRLITWGGRKPGILKNVYYPLEYQHLIDNHQYSLLLTDGSFFQFYYEFNEEDDLCKARLAFYPKPISTSDSIESLIGAADDALDREDEALYEHIYNWVELLEIKKQSPSNTSHIRFDYDSTVEVHAPSHIQFSGVQEFRVSAEFYPLPLTFIELCLPMLPFVQGIDPGALNFACRNKYSIERPTTSIFLTG